MMDYSDCGFYDCDGFCTLFDDYCLYPSCAYIKDAESERLGTLNENLEEQL